MSLWAIVPVKSLHGGKTRLSEVLSDEERFLLNRALVQNTINSLLRVNQINEILVVSSDDMVFDLVDSMGVRFFKEEGDPNLNHALTCASKYANLHDANSLLILPADLPLINDGTITAMLTSQVQHPFMVIAPDRKESGTNGLYLSDFVNFIYRFGPDSYHLHLKEARRLNFHIKIFRNESIGLDLDLPEDINILSGTGYDMVSQKA